MNTSHANILQDAASTRIMGILNVTPDSFYDGGRYNAPEQAAAHAARMAAEGAHIIDVGAESSRPGAEPIGLDEELRRALPAVASATATGLPVSIDTCRADTARRAIALGAAMVNDITGLRGDPDMASVIADTNVFCVVMHMRGNPKTMQDNPVYDDVVADVRYFFETQIAHGLDRGIAADRIWLDPGFGFGKTVEQNLELLRRLDEFHELGFPLLIGTSNKSTIGAILDAPPGERSYGTAATVAIAIAKGVHCVRVHEVKTMAQTARMCDAVLRGRMKQDG